MRLETHTPFKEVPYMMKNRQMYNKTNTFKVRPRDNAGLIVMQVVEGDMMGKSIRVTPMRFRILCEEHLTEIGREDIYE